MMATTNESEYQGRAGDAFWDVKLMVQRYITGEFIERVHKLDVERIRKNYQQAREFAREHGEDVSMFPLELNLQLQSESIN